MPFALELPFRDRSAYAVPTTPRRLRARLKTLASAEPCEAARRLVELLDAQNQAALAPEQRLHLLELVRPATRGPLDALAARVQVQSAPLPARTAEVARLSRHLLTALLAGYETVAAASPADRSSQRAVALVSERTLQLRAELLLRYLEADEPVPAGFWQYAYAAYARAETGGAARRAVADRQWHGRRRPTPTDAFVSLVLLALAQPRGLRPGEAARIQRTIQHWCRDAHLAPAAMAPADAAERGSVFAVALDAVTAPSQWRLRPGEGRAQERVLDVARVVARAEQQYRAANGSIAYGKAAPDSREAIGPTGLKRLLDNWNPRPIGRDSGTRAGQSASVVFGIDAIQRQLTGADTESPPRKRPARSYTQLRPSEVLQTIGADDVSDAGSSFPHARAAVEPDTQDRVVAQSDASAAPDWLLENVDARSFRLRWQGTRRSQATVGALVAVRTAQVDADRPREGAGWRLGVVRWLQFLDDAHFAIGCDLLSSRPRAATLRHEPLDRHRKTRPRGDAVPAILLPSTGGQAATSSVLVAANRFRAQAILELDAAEHTVRVQLADTREHSSHFTLFELAPAPTRGRTSGVPEASTRGSPPAG